jgi:hypothetical protein
MEADVVALNAECGRCGRLVARCQCLYPDPHRASRDREDGWDELMAMLDRPARVLPALKELMAGVRLDEPWTERALRAEQRVRDLEEAQGELLGLVDFYGKTIWVLEDGLDHERRTNTALVAGFLALVVWAAVDVWRGR